MIRTIRIYATAFLSLCFCGEVLAVNANNKILGSTPVPTLSQLVGLAFENYPMRHQLAALESEANALRKKGDALWADSPSMTLRYQDDRAFDNFGLIEYEAGIDLPIRRWGQRDAEQNLARSAHRQIESGSRKIRLEVAGLVREALWNRVLKEEERRFEIENVNRARLLVATVKRRVEIGELPRADLLLAQSELKARQSELESASLEAASALEDYSMITGTEQLPESWVELPAGELNINETHPLLSELKNHVSRLQAQLSVARQTGSGQPVISLGARSERGDRNDEPVESLGVSLELPFAGKSYRNPELAALNRELIEASSIFEWTQRKLRRDQLKARTQLVTNENKVTLSHARREIAIKHLRISRLAFETGEITLIDMLKIEENSGLAILEAARQKIYMQRDIARLNQITGQLP